MSKSIQITFCVNTENDTRHTASDVGSIIVPQAIARRLAEKIDTFGSAAFIGKYAKYSPKLKTGRKVASGHGVTITYRSGRKVEVRAR